MSENRKKKKKQAPPPIELRYLIGGVNTPFGKTLCDSLSANLRKNELAPIIYGTTINDPKNEAPLSNHVNKTIDTTKISFLGQLILDCDIIIYDLRTCDPNEVEYAIKTLKMGDFKNEKILICVSSVMAWAETPPKEKKEGEEEAEVAEDEQEEPDTEPEEPIDNQQQEDAPPKKQYVRFSEKDYTLRKPSQPFAYMKSLETLCLAAGNKKPNLKSYVLCSGILYGQDEFLFKPLFEQAWLQHPPELAYYGDGRNRIPMIHIQDLAEFVKKTVERPPTIPYIFAIDYNKKPTQKGIIKAISGGVGTGKVKEKKIEEMPQDLENKDVFLLNLRMRPSKAFIVNEEAEENNEEENEEDNPDKVQKFKFNWISKDGLQKNIDKINLEFNKNNALKSNRIFITGPPGSGKTHYGKKIAEFYNIPHILIKDLFNKALELPEEDELGAEIRTALEEVKNDMLTKAQEKLEKDKEKMEKKGLKAPENLEVDPNTIYPRLPDELLFKLYKKRLMLNDCQNRGFVLDGYPKTYEQAKGIFMMQPPVKEGEEETDGPLILNENIVPLTVINLEASDSFLLQKLQTLPEEKLKNTHFTENDMLRRLKIYRDANNQAKGKAIMLDFFKENKIEVLEVNLENLDPKAHFDKINAFIERKGKFKNFQKHELIEERKRLELQELLQKQKIEKQKVLNQKMEEKETERRLLAEEEYKLKIEDFRKQEKNILDSRSLPLREYLNYNVVPFVSEGIFEIYKTMPDDPVDFLAEYLFKRSLDVKFSDPKKFMEEN